MVVLFVKIKGKVQRVWFRRWVVGQVRKMGGISGFVRNNQDGTVELLCKGSIDNLDKLLLACKKGPLLAKVTDVEVAKDIDFSYLPPIIDNKFYKI